MKKKDSYLNNLRQEIPQHQVTNNVKSRLYDTILINESKIYHNSMNMLERLFCVNPFIWCYIPPHSYLFEDLFPSIRLMIMFFFSKASLKAKLQPQVATFQSTK